MATLDDIVNVQISLQTRVLSRADFGTPIIIGPLVSFSERVRSYSSAKEVAEDGLPANFVKALNAAFSQTPRPKIVKVGRLDVTSFALKIPDVLPSVSYAFNAGAFQYKVDIVGEKTASEIFSALAEEINETENSPITAQYSENTDYITINFATNNHPEISNLINLEFESFSVSNSAQNIQNQLSEILAEDSGFYGIGLTERDTSLQAIFAEWTEANEKLFVTASNQEEIKSATSQNDLAYNMKNKQYYRTVVMYGNEADTEYPDVAWMSRVFTIKPGGETWALKQLAGITPARLTSTEERVIKSKNANYFTYHDSDVALTQPGKVAAGEWIDVIRFRDWLKNTIQINMVQMLINRDKLPYTNAGIAVCVENLRSSLTEGQTAGGIAPDEKTANNKTSPGFEISYPDVNDVPASIKGQRLLNLEFNAKLAGAIQVVDINGAVSYELS